MNKQSLFVSGFAGNDNPSKEVSRKSVLTEEDYGIGNWFLDVTKICKDTMSEGTKMKQIITKTCGQCRSVFDLTSSGCPICGETFGDPTMVIPDYQGIVQCWVRRKCLECQSVCYERSCPICGAKTRPYRELTNTNQAREPKAWKITSLRVRTPTGPMNIQCIIMLNTSPFNA